MKATFCGHSHLINKDAILKTLIEEINHLACLGVTTFYSGGYGEFDMLAVSAIHKVQKNFPNIQNIIVVPYISQSHLSRYEYTIEKYNAHTIYPFETEIIPRLAIIKRNEWMVDNSNYVIAYVTRINRGAFQTLKYAKRKKKNIIYIHT